MKQQEKGTQNGVRHYLIGYGSAKVGELVHTV